MEQTAVEYCNSKIKLFESWVETKQISWKEYHKKKDSLIEKAKEMEKEQMLNFANWLDKLTPSQRVSVWSKDGSASGLFTMDNEQLFEQYYNETFKSE